MTTAPAFSPFDRLDWRKAGLATASVVINLALLTTLSFTALGAGDRDRISIPPPVYLDIEPRPLLPEERPREPVYASPTTPAQSASQTQRAVSRSATADPSAERPTPPRPRVTLPAPQGVPTPANPWRVDPDDQRAGMARGLRQGAVGCASPELLNELERRHCRERFGERAAVAPPITGTGNPERDAVFAREGARRLAQWEAQRRPLSGGAGVVGPADCIGSNFGTGCAGAHLDPSLAPDSSRDVRTRRDGPPASGVPLVPGASGPGREPQ